MSVCVIVKVGEGLVLASDSASTVAGASVTPEGQPGPQGVVKIFFNSTKIFQIGKLPVGIITWGAGSFQSRTVASLVEEFENLDEIRKLQRQALDVKLLTEKIWNFMSSKSDDLFTNIPTEGRPQTGLMVGGYSKENFFPEEYFMVIPSKKPAQIRPDIEGKPNFGANWYGLTDAIVRFHHGRDDRVIKVLEDMELNPDDLKKMNERIQKEIQYPILFNAMPLGDAIDYAKFWFSLQFLDFAL